MNLGELTGVKLLGVLVLGAALVTGGLYYTVFKSQRDENAMAQTKLQAKERENAELEAYRPKLADIERQLASLKQQLEIERRIVPDEKEIDNFMRMVSGEARKAGVEVRRYTRSVRTLKEFYTEVPFEVEFDGPYYSMLGFFDRLTKVERIVNVANLMVASVRKTGRRAGEAHLPVRAQRNGGGHLPDDDIFQSRSGSRGGDGGQARAPRRRNRRDRMKPTMAISVCVLAAGLAVAQNPRVIQNTRATMNGVHDTSAAASNAALGVQAKPTARMRSARRRRSRRTRAAEDGAARKRASVAHGRNRTVVAVEAKRAAAPKAEAAGSPKKVGEMVGHSGTRSGRWHARRMTDARLSKYNANGKRDPFVSPVVAHAAGGSGCSTGKKCLEIGDHQSARCGACGKRIHCGGQQQFEQSVLPAGERSGVQRLRREDHRRLDRLPGNAAGPVRQDVYAGSDQEDHVPAV